MEEDTRNAIQIIEEEKNEKLYETSNKPKTRKEQREERKRQEEMKGKAEPAIARPEQKEKPKKFKSFCELKPDMAIE